MIHRFSIPSPPTNWAQFHVGPLTVHTYALCILAGIAAAIAITDRRLRSRGGAPGFAVDAALWAVPLGIVVARIYHVLTHPGDYFAAGDDLWNVFAIWDGGNAIYGAELGGALGILVACGRAGIRFLSFADALAPGLLVAQAIGRLGNWFNHEPSGSPRRCRGVCRSKPAIRSSRRACRPTRSSTRCSCTRSSGTCWARSSSSCSSGGSGCAGVARSRRTSSGTARVAHIWSRSGSTRPAAGSSGSPTTSGPRSASSSSASCCSSCSAGAAPVRRRASAGIRPAPWCRRRFASRGPVRSVGARDPDAACGPRPGPTLPSCRGPIRSRTSCSPASPRKP